MPKHVIMKMQNIRDKREDPVTSQQEETGVMAHFPATALECILLKYSLQVSSLTRARVILLLHQTRSFLGLKSSKDSQFI